MVLVSPRHCRGSLKIALINRITRGAKRFGFKEVVLRPLRGLISAILIPFLSPGTFWRHREQLNYFYHRYNATWCCERAVEIPLICSFLESAKEQSTLEIGNVLAHYFPINHDVVDKFERGTFVFN